MIKHGAGIYFISTIGMIAGPFGNAGAEIATNSYSCPVAIPLSPASKRS
jgi:hypothetical protein